MKPSHFTTPRCMSEATFTVGYSPMYTIGDDIDFHGERHFRYRWVIVLMVIALCLLPFITGKR